MLESALIRPLSQVVAVESLTANPGPILPAFALTILRGADLAYPEAHRAYLAGEPYSEWEVSSHLRAIATTTKAFDAHGNPKQAVTKLDGVSPAHPYLFCVEELAISAGTAITQAQRVRRELEARSNEPRQCMIHAAPTDATRLGTQQGEKFPAQRVHFDNDPRVRLAWLDIDNIEVPEGMDPTSDAAVRWMVDTHLPPAVHEGLIVYQFSNSAGMKRRLFKCHLGLMLAEPVRLKDVESWVKNWNQRTGEKTIDEATLRAVQKNYFAAPLFDDPSIDPFRGRSRWGVIDGKPLSTEAFYFVPVVDHAVVAQHAAQLNDSNRSKIFGQWSQVLANLNESTGFHDPLNYAVVQFVALHGQNAMELVNELIQAARDGYETAVAAGRLRPRGYAYGEIDRIPTYDIPRLLSMGYGVRRVRGGLQENLRRLEQGEPRTVAGVRYWPIDFAWSAIVSGIRSSPVDEVISRVQAAAGNLNIQFDRMGEWARKIVAEREQAALTHRGFSRYTPTRVSSLDAIPLDGDVGLVCIRAPHGSGKTELIGRRVCENHGYTLHLSPRISLAGDAATRLDLQNYRDRRDPTARGLASCVLSLANDDTWEQARRADVLLIDEATAMLDLLAAKGESGRPLARRPAMVLERFSRLIGSRPVYVLDADLGDTEVAWLEYLSGRQATVYELPEDFSHLTFEEVTFTAITRSRPEGRVLLVTDSLNFIRKLPWSDRGKVLRVTGETIDTEEVKAFIANPNEVLSRECYDTVICTPVVDTGLSITVPIFDHVVGVFFDVIPPETMLQMLRRFRLATHYTIARGASVPHMQRHQAVLHYGLLQLLGKAVVPGERIDAYTDFAIARTESVSAREAGGVNGLFAIVEASGGIVLRGGGLEDPNWLREWREIGERVSEERIAAILAARDLEDAGVKGLPRTPDNVLALVKHQVKRTLALDEVAADDVRWVFKHTPAAAYHFEIVRWGAVEHSLPGDPAVARQWATKRVELLQGAIQALGLDPMTLAGEVDQAAIQQLVAFIAQHAVLFETTGLFPIKFEANNDGRLSPRLDAGYPGAFFGKFMKKIGLAIQHNRRRGDARRWWVARKSFEYMLAAAARRRREHVPSFCEVHDWAAWDHKRGRQAKDLMVDGVLPLNTSWLVSQGVNRANIRRWRQSVLKALPPHLVEWSADGEIVIAERRLDAARVWEALEVLFGRHVEVLKRDGEVWETHTFDPRGAAGLDPQAPVAPFAFF